MSFDEDEVRRALDARSGEPSPEFKARVRHTLAGPPVPTVNWTAAVAVIVVTLLTAGSVGVLIASRHGRPGPVASGPRVTTPSPFAASTVQLSAPSSNVVWALVDHHVLYRSVDGAAHWEQRSTPDQNVWASISFVDGSEGWLLDRGSPATQCQEAQSQLWHTTDGGATWRKVATTGILDAQCKDAIYFADPQHGFIASWDDSHRPTVYSTLDGGSTWRKAVLPDGPLFVTSPGGFTLHVNWIKSFGGTVYLQASGAQDDQTWHDRDFVYISTDQGATWSWKQKLPAPSLVIVTASRWLQLDAAGHLSESTNGGQAFAPLTSDFASDTPMAGASMVFADSQVGYLVSAGSVQRTVNGGAHWTQVHTPWTGVPIHPPSASPSPSPIYLPSSADLSAPSANVVWALVGGARLFVSTDSGTTWQERSVPQAAAGGEATEISFVDDTHGWLSTCANTTTLLWRTTDGARTWNTVSSPFPPDQCLLGLAFVDQSRGFITERFDYSPPAIYTTPDGGNTWNGAPIQNPPGFVAGQPGYAFFVTQITKVGSAYYLAAQGSLPSGDRAWIFRSTDNGATWSYYATTASPAGSIAFVTATRWLQLGAAPGQSVETTDAGKTWHAYATKYSQAAPIAPQVVFGSSSVGYATVRGEIQRTTDGGVLWRPLTTPGTVPGAAPTATPTATPAPVTLPTEAQISAPSTKVVWALIAGGRLFRSLDGGQTWQERPWAPHRGGGGNPVISFVDDTQGWALFPGVPATQCGQAGAQLWHTVDAGSHWSVVSEVDDQTQSNTGLPFDQCKDYATFVDAKDGFVAGHDTQNQPIVSTTADGGSTWSRAALPDPPGFARGGGNSLQVTSIRKFGTELLAGTESPTGAQFVYESTNGGASWTFVAPVNANAHVTVVFVTATRWLSIGNDGSGLETTDAGKTWHPFTSDYRDAAGVASSFVFADASTGYGTVRGGIQVTADGGAHWTRIKTPGT